MSEFKDRISKQVEIINNSISNDEERIKVLSCIQSLIQDFSTYVVQLTERQNELDEKMTDVFDILTNIESELGGPDSNEIFGNCPYCGEEIPLIFKDGDFADIECPNCHNTIELEMEYDDNSQCSGNCCGSCCSDSFNCKENGNIDDEKKDNCNKKKRK